MNEAIPGAASQPTEQQRHLRRNVAAFMADFGALAGVCVHTPDDSAPGVDTPTHLIGAALGLLTTTWQAVGCCPTAGWRWLSDKPRKKPVLVAATAIGRPILLVLAALLMFARPSDSTVILVGLFLESSSFVPRTRSPASLGSTFSARLSDQPRGESSAQDKSWAGCWRSARPSSYGGLWVRAAPISTQLCSAVCAGLWRNDRLVIG